MITSQNLKVIELRNYLLKPDAREPFIEYFENHFLDSQNVLGGYVLGQFRIKDADDRFFWIRGFEDMASRGDFLREFYVKGGIWKEFGSGANEMMLEWDNVHLLKPLNLEFINSDEIINGKGIVVVNVYIADDNQLDALITFLQDEYAPLLKSLQIENITLWRSETGKNDFTRLPVIQNESILATLTTYKDETDYQAKLKQSAELTNRMPQFIIRQNTLILYPTEKSLMGSR